MAQPRHFEMEQNQGSEEILTVSEVAQILKVPISWVYDHTRPRCSDPLPCFKIGKYLRFTAKDIFAYIQFIQSRKTM